MKTKQEIFSAIDSAIKTRLEEGTLPWRKTWKTGLPANIKTRKVYNGINF